MIARLYAWLNRRLYGRDADEGFDLMALWWTFDDVPVLTVEDWDDATPLP